LAADYGAREKRIRKWIRISDPQAKPGIELSHRESPVGLASRMAAKDSAEHAPRSVVTDDPRMSEKQK
jgi:hypothetical protein